MSPSEDPWAYMQLADLPPVKFVAVDKNKLIFVFLEEVAVGRTTRLAIFVFDGAPAGRKSQDFRPRRQESAREERVGSETRVDRFLRRIGWPSARGLQPAYETQT